MNGEVFGLVPSRSRHLRPGSSRAVEVTRRWALNLTIRVYAKQHLQLSKSWDHHRIPWLGLAPELPQFKTAGDAGPAADRRSQSPWPRLATFVSVSMDSEPIA